MPFGEWFGALSGEDAATGGTISDITSDTLDVTNPAGPSTEIELHPIGSPTGPVGDATDVATVTIDEYGRVTALTSTAITFPPSGVTSVTAAAGNSLVATPTTGAVVINRAALTGDVTASADSNATTLKNTGPGATGPLGDGTHVAVVTIDAQGRVTGLTSTPVTFPAQSPGGLAQYGDGSDGTHTFDGTTTILGIVPNPNSAVNGVYTLTRDIYLAAGTLNSGITIKSAGFRIFCAGTFTGGGSTAVIQNNGGAGGNGTGSAGGSAGTATNIGTINRGGAGGAGGVTTGTIGGATTVSQGGAGGAGGAGVSAGGAAGTAGAPASSNSSIHALPGALTMSTFAGGSFTGGGGGGGGGGDGTAGGGGGGAGGAGIVVAAKSFAGTGAIQCRGGAGGNGFATSTLGCGGGAGGGGGPLSVISSSVSGGAIAGWTIDAAGGAGGTHHGTAGVDGANGNAGIVVLLPN